MSKPNSPKNPPLDQKVTTKGCITILGVFIVLIVIIISQCSESDRELTKEEIRINYIEQAFNPWDGSHINLTAYIKSKLNDPNSFEHLKTTYIDFQTGLRVTTEFTANNQLGGKMRSTVVAETDSTGNITKIISWE